MEVEDPEKPCSLEYNNFVTLHDAHMLDIFVIVGEQNVYLVFQADVCLVRI